MNKEAKLRVHLESIIFEDLAPGTVLNASQMDAQCAAATDSQKLRAYKRALVKNPVLIDDERL